MSLSTNQQQINAFSDLVETTTWSSRDSTLENMEKIYSEVDHASKEGIVLCFALAKVYDDLGDLDESFKLLMEGNLHHKAGKTDTLEDARMTTSAVKRIFSSQTVITLDSPTDIRPLFIVGMPRSGTSLTEQILASHSRVHGGGELKLMGQWCGGYLKLYDTHGDAAPLNNYLTQLQEHYLKGLRAISSKRFITDKMPMNFFWIGFIRAAFPAAGIINTVRDPMAVCWSNFRTAFAGSSNGYSCDLEETGEFFTLYQDLMTFWHGMFPGHIHELHYERLTENPREEIAGLLDYCGLDWEDACLDFHKNTREVATASRSQVKQPLYKGSSEAWKRYDKYLGPLKKALGKYAQAQG